MLCWRDKRMRTMSPETLARQYHEAERQAPKGGWRDRHEMIHTAMKGCVDRGDREGQAFWCAVYGHYLTFESLFVVTGELPGAGTRAQGPSIAQYVAMAFWDDGSRGPEDAVLSALYRKDLEALAFFRAFLAHYGRLSA